MGDLGQIVQLRYHIRNETQITESLRHSDVVYNLVGRSYPTKNFSLKDVNVDSCQLIAKLARENNVSKFIHLSSLNASETSKSEFLRTKWLGEQRVREEFPDATIVRTSRVFGHDDWFLSQIGFFAKHISFIPLINGGTCKMRPVFVILF
jgi:NADH dehydrogenase (ubiquinone) 1 alpha subcomplex subunit 9